MSALASLASLRGIARHPWQMALSVLGIALGVAVVVGIELAGASSLRGFRLAADATAGRATHEVSAGSAGLPETLFAALRAAAPDVPMAPVVEAHALVLGDAAAAPRARTTLTVFGIDPFSEGELRPWLGSLGAADSGALALMAEPATGLLSRETAARLGLAPGDEVRLRVGSRVGAVRLLGTFAPEGERSAESLADLLVVDVATAQELAGRTGRLTRIDLALPEGPGGARVVPALEALLPPGAALRESALRRGGLEELTRSFRLNLRALSLLALLVGVFLVYNTITFSVVQRRPLIATLRTLGATRGEIFRIVAGEALWLGILGTALGLVLGVRLAESLLALVTQTMNDLYFVVAVRDVHVDWPLLVQSAALGIGATLAGALAPAWEATRERPRIALAASTLESGFGAWTARLAALGAVSAVLAIALLAWRTASLVPAFLGLFCVVLSAGLWTPLLVGRLARAVAPLYGRAFGMFGRHAARGIAAHLSRTSIAIAALAVAISATIGMGVMIDSFRSTFVKWLALSLEADVYASAPTLVSSHNESTLDPAAIALLSAAPGVAQVTTYRGFQTDFRGRRILGSAVSMNPVRERSFEFVDADPADVWPAFDDQATAIVSEPFGYRHGVGRGDHLELATDRGTVRFRVLGTHKDFASDSGFVMVSRANYERFFDDRGVTSLEIFAVPGVDPEQLVASLRALVPDGQEILIRSNRALRENSLSVFDRTFAITGVLRTLATLVAFVGILSALFSLELERAREIGVLRAQGVTPREVRRLVLAETGLIGALAGLVAMPLGCAVAVALIRVINKRSFGWSLDLRLDPWLFVSALGLAVLAALLAGLVPAWRMSRARPALVLRGD